MASRGNPAWVKGGASPNPSGRALPERLAQRSLTIACQAAATDEEVAEWLLVIASGRWPDIRPAPKPAKGETPIAVDLTTPPDGAQRLAAFKEFILRRNGQPMQSAVLQAEILVRARALENANDAIDLDELDPIAAGAVELMLRRKLLGEANTAGAIDVDSAEVEP